MQRPMDHRFLTKNVSYSRDMVTFLTQCGRLTEPYRGHGQAAAHHPRRPTMSSTGTVMIDWMSCPIAASNLAHRMPLGAAGWSSCARWHAVPVHQKDKTRPRKVIFAVYFSRSQAPCGSAAFKVLVVFVFFVRKERAWYTYYTNFDGQAFSNLSLSHSGPLSHVRSRLVQTQCWCPQGRWLP